MPTSVTVPFSTNLAVNGTAKLETNQTGEFVWGDAADMDMTANIPVAAWKGIFAIDAPTSDNAADFAVSIVAGGQAAFEAAVKAALLAAVMSAAGETNGNGYNAAAVGDTLDKYLLNVAQHDMDAALANADGIAASLSAEQMKELALTNLDAACETAAQAVYSSFAASADHRKRLALDLLNGDYSDVTENTDVPFEALDTVLIRFSAAQTFVVSEDAKNDKVAGGMENPASLGVNNAAAHYSIGNRVIDITVTLTA